jgi:hypothetical protein
MNALTGWLTRSAPKAAGVFSFGFLDPQRVAWRKRGAEVGAWADGAGWRFEKDALPAETLAGCPGLRTTDAVPVREAWHRVSGDTEGLSFTVFDLRSKCRAVAGSRAPVDRFETLALFSLPGPVIPELSLWVFSTARPGTPEAAAVTVARRWAGGVGGVGEAAARDFVVDSCVATWKPGDSGRSGEVVLGSHPGLFLSGRDPDAVRRLFGPAVAEFFSDKRGWRVEIGAGALLASCDVERLPAGWSAGGALPGLIASEHLEELVASTAAIARLFRDEAAATVP